MKTASSEDGAPIPIFLASKNIIPYITNELRDGPLKPINYTVRNASASKGDLRETELRLLKEIDSVRLEIQKSKAETIKWVAGIITAQTVAIIAAIIALMK